MEKPIAVDCSKYITDSRVAFMFSCPGRKEAECGRPCAGGTGTNLDELIRELHQFMPALFPDLARYDHIIRYNYTILNASNKIHYKALDGKTEADNKEIISDTNIKRLLSELELPKAEIVIACGCKARVAVDEIIGRSNFLTIYSEHLSPRNINTNARRKYGTTTTEETIKKIAAKIIADIKRSNISTAVAVAHSVQHDG